MPSIYTPSWLYSLVVYLYNSRLTRSSHNVRTHLPIPTRLQYARTHIHPRRVRRQPESNSSTPRQSRPQDLSSPYPCRSKSPASARRPGSPTTFAHLTDGESSDSNVDSATDPHLHGSFLTCLPALPPPSGDYDTGQVLFPRQS